MKKNHLRYGFRYDPMKWVKNDRSWRGAVVRTGFLECPQPEDAGLIEARIKAEKPGARQLVWHLGYSPNSPQVQSAMAVMRDTGLSEHGKWAELVFRTQCLAADDPAKLVKSLAERCLKESPYAGCPWSGGEITQTLWMQREHADVVPAVTFFLETIYADMTDAGCCNKVDPWIYLDCAGMIDLPVSRKLVQRQLPMILRSQAADGGWGENSVAVFRALAKHGLLEPLRKLPPLPPDWKIVRSIPAPEGDLFSLTWGNKRLWVLDRKSNMAISLSPTDGAVLSRTQLPGKEPWSVGGIGWWDDSLAAVQRKPEKKLFQIAPDTGAVRKEVKTGGQWAPVQIEDEIWLGTGNLRYVHNLKDSTKNGARDSICGGPIFLTSQKGDMWLCDWLVPSLLFKCDRKGVLLDFADAPFFKSMEGSWEDQLGVRGITWDGENLWVLDNKSKRICVIQRNVQSATE
ncbi:hypothetical protein ACFLSJ_05610 [Verrucomicrobiota bacterium]